MIGVQGFTILNQGPEPLLVKGINVTPFSINTNVRSQRLTAPRTYEIVVHSSGAEVFDVNFEGPGKKLNIIPKAIPYPVQITTILD